MVARRSWTSCAGSFRAGSSTASRWSGTAPQIVTRLKALAAAGMQEIVIWPFPAQGQDTEDFMFKLAKDVLPHFSERPTRAA